MVSKLKKKHGIFITFEGTAEGVGKTTQAHLLFEKLRLLGVKTVLTREPGGTEVGKQLREILLHHPGKLSKACEVLLFQADRAQNYKEVLKPALLSGKVVICDRYIDSTLVYQGAGRGWRLDELWKLHQLATNGLLPDLTVVLAGTSHKAPELNDRFEKLSNTNFFTRVRDGLLRQASTAERYKVLNANQPKQELADQILRIVQERFVLPLQG